MTVIKDSEKREWDIRFTVGVIRRIRELTGINLYKIVSDQNEEALKEISKDAVLIVDIIYAACQPQCEKEGITREQFYERFTGVEVVDATYAIMEEIAAFFGPLAKEGVKEIEAARRQALAEIAGSTTSS